MVKIGTDVDASGTNVNLVDSKSASGNIHLMKIKQPRNATLDKANYHAWHAHFSSLLRGNQLIRHVDGTINLDDPLVVQQDQLVLGWLLSSISPIVLASITSYETSAEV